MPYRVLFLAFIYGLKWVMPQRVVDLFAYWRVHGGTFQSVVVLKMSCLMLCVWREK